MLLSPMRRANSLTKAPTVQSDRCWTGRGSDRGRTNDNHLIKRVKTKTLEACFLIRKKQTGLQTDETKTKKKGKPPAFGTLPPTRCYPLLGDHQTRSSCAGEETTSFRVNMVCVRARNTHDPRNGGQIGTWSHSTTARLGSRRDHPHRVQTKSRVRRSQKASRRSKPPELR